MILNQSLIIKINRLNKLNIDWILYNKVENILLDNKIIIKKILIIVLLLNVYYVYKL